MSTMFLALSFLLFWRCLCDSVASRGCLQDNTGNQLEIMGFWTLMEGLLLFANALAILNEDRFLAPKGWTLAELHQTGRRNSLKGQIVGLIHACHYMRLPLMLFNLIVIVVKLFSG